MKKGQFNRAQAAIEVVLAITLVAMMIYSILKVTLWAGIEMVKVQTDHDSSLSQNAVLDFSSLSGGPMGQVDSGSFHRPARLGAAWLDF